MSKDNFEALLAELNAVSDGQEELAKSINEAGADDDEAIAAAAAEAGVNPPAASGDEDGEGDDDDDVDGDAPVLGKSFEVDGADGKKHKAVDATDLIKSLIEHQEATDSTLAKALSGFTDVVKAQGDMIKSLSDQVKALAGQGRGRKTVLSVTEKPDAGSTLAKSDADGLSMDQFFAKANAAFDAGRIDGKDLTTIDVCRRSGVLPSTDLVSKVLQA